MRPNYTRQRQGRDFSILKRLHREPEPPSNAEIEREKKSTLEALERYKADSEKNRAPTDGAEPPEMEGYTR
jgi:hypothetical protein